jgi:hypothetical protein
MFGYRQVSRGRVILEGFASAYGIAHEGEIPVSYCKYGAHAVLGSLYGVTGLVRNEKSCNQKVIV